MSKLGARASPHTSNPLVRFGRTLLVVAGLLSVVAALLVASVLIGLQTEFGRRYGCGQIEAAINDALRGTIKLGSCTELGLRQVRVEGLSVRDPADREVLTIEALAVRPDVWALLRGRLRISEARIDGPVVRLIGFDEEELGIVRAFSPMPAPSSEQGEESDAAPAIEVLLDWVHLTEGTVADLPEGISAHGVEASATLSYNDNLLRLTIRQLRARLVRDGQRVAKLSKADGVLRFDEQARSELQIVLEVDDGRLAADGTYDNRTLEGRIQLSELDLAGLVDGARGAIDGEIEVSASFAEGAVDPSSIETIDLVARIDGEELAYDQVHARSVRIRAEIEGDLASPRVRVSLDAEEGEVDAARFAEMHLVAEGSEGKYRIDGTVPLPNGVVAHLDLDAGTQPYALDGKIRVRGAAVSPLVARVRRLRLRPGDGVTARSITIEGRGVSLRVRGRYSFAGRSKALVEVRELNLGRMRALLDLGPSMDGKLRGKLRFAGSLDHPKLDVALSLADGTLGVVGPSDFDLEATLEDAVLSAGIELADAQGTWADAQVSAQLDLRRLVRHGGPADILRRPWTISAALHERRVDQLPIDIELSSSALARMTLSASSGGGPIEGRADAHLALLASASPCPGAEPVEISARAELGKRTEVELEARHSGASSSDAARLAFDLQTPFRRWIRDGLPSRMPTINGEGRAGAVRLETFPVLCEHASGRLDATLQASRLFTSSQDASLAFEAVDLRLSDGEPVRMQGRVHLAGAQATAQAALEFDSTTMTDLEARVPLVVGGRGIPISLGPGEIEARADLRDAPLAVLLAPVPSISRPGGRMSGQLRASGPANDMAALTVDGRVRFLDASLTLEDPFIRLDGVNGELAIDNDRIIVESLTAEDRGGTIALDGSIGVSQWKPTEVHLDIQADGYPLRRDGVLIATLFGTLQVRGDLSEHPRVLRVTLQRDVSLELAEDLQREIQELGQHPQVIYEGQPGFDRSLSVEEALAIHRRTSGPDPRAPPKSTVIVRADSSEPFWVRRPDFSAQLSLDIEVHDEAGRTWLQGEVGIRRGFIVLLTKSFDIEKGTIRFTGADPIDPTVDLAAVHRLRSGDTVTVKIDGRASAPELSFSTTASGANTDAEIIALLLGVSRNTTEEQDARRETGAILAGLTAGLVGTIARRELGQYAPIIALESEGTSETTSVRIGTPLDPLVPEAWQDVVLGVYLEGVVGGSQTNRTRAGFLLELLFPHHLSTIAIYEQPDNWSLDLMWEP